ncbi:unnamed protein product [Somion occarium]|uniref:Rad50/SbcC-type AAA domain-containing protein n=1 Tax=Somion occarium TaxID=3059160 RepID=A0ABP1DZB9_9APHY
MACLNKLAIRGIRSFDDKQIAVIEFFSPVTVIVGHNGSGKTTIIECLKYATTGDQPPNTRGGAFVHDPKMANEREVKAQVKLRFLAANGQRMLVVRNLSVSLKKSGGLTMKTLESILALADGNAEKGGKRGVISTKCAEMDAEIPSLLGVSKAVLENVIFCHQEDSYWPLAEPSILKRKFDDIFEATKYTKALDNIKALRKERAADLKAEKERLESLAREKGHADKLRARIADLNSSMGAKELEYEEAKKEYERLVASNQRFYDSATKFRDIYSKVESLQEKKERFEQDLAEARENLQELEGTDEELSERLRNFDEHIAKQKQKKMTEDARLQDLEDELAQIRKSHVALTTEQGKLEEKLQAQERLIADREELVRDLAAKHQLRGYDHSPLEKEQVLEFTTKLSELQRKQIIEADNIQADSKASNDDYRERLRTLDADLQRLKHRKESLRERTTLQGNISEAERDVDAAQALPAKLRTLESEMEDKERRLEIIKDELKAAKYEERIAEKESKYRSLEVTRDGLNNEFRTLSLQADSRAKLDLNRASLKTKSAEVKNVIEINNPKFRKLVGADAHVETMERELDRVHREKERQRHDLMEQRKSADSKLSNAEAELSSTTRELKAAKDKLKALDKQIKAVMDDSLAEGSTPDEKYSDAKLQLEAARSEIDTNYGAAQKLKEFRSAGRARKCCPLCTRKMNVQEVGVFENAIQAELDKASEARLVEVSNDVTEWEQQISILKDLTSVANSRDEIKTTTIPGFEAKFKAQEAKIPSLSETAEKALHQLNEVEQELKEITNLKQHASMVAKTQTEIDELKRSIASLESELSATGSTRTADDVQLELGRLSDEMRANERERQSLAGERERLLNSMRKNESDILQMRLQLSDLKSQLRDKDVLEKRISDMKREQTDSHGTLKDLDVQISSAQEPIQRLQREHQEIEKDWNDKLSRAQRSSQELNISMDKLESMNKQVERQLRARIGRQLKECNEKIEEYEAEIQDSLSRIESVREVLRKIEKEISDAATSMSNLRNNLRVRKLTRDIIETQSEIDSYDMEEAARAKRVFQERYKVEKDRETEMQSKYAHLGGELSSYDTQLKQLEADLKEFKDINKKYKDQLVKVKLSDMANSDLEKYAKALDNAIMKYHSLKMEEVNDTMRHLWNKTYQGTDIDGIKISSDPEGGATKRSYNYRVVMTKDQVEMDMRGRCSAGQKMLASIIIRLALADSFGQNCGILALDEPTNALDTENIDALAASLVDIINERKNQGNFQLIIITHDENFLGKLGRSDVMEYYWRVSRDSRQKSVIERHRFG